MGSGLFKKKGTEKARYDAKADWDSFARNEEVVQWYNEIDDSVIKDNIGYLLKEPPKKQMIIDGNFDWVVVPLPDSSSEAELLFLYIRRIRNNLFHGGKFAGNNWEDHMRSGKLIEASINILNAAIDAHAGVKKIHVGAWSQLLN